MQIFSHAQGFWHELLISWQAGHMHRLEAVTT